MIACHGNKVKAYNTATLSYIDVEYEIKHLVFERFSLTSPSNICIHYTAIQIIQGKYT